ncbi:MAG: phosphate acyltransferase PlsX [Bacteroidota bacterium]|nr:phosphate acyltransferase PlsX [Candidatus Kapabacteria bacterium]MDW8219723.1 phosphate acyltransferase PlsX [Bacteroidota bacterium]
MAQPIRIVVDAMGGDFAPQNEILGAYQALRYFQEHNINVEILLIGQQDAIQTAIHQHGIAPSQFSILHADEVVAMDDEPAQAFRKKRQSSLYLGLQHHKDGHADAFVSAGNTGAVMSHSTLILGRITGVSRPTIGTFFPTTTSQPTLVVDAGANVDCKAKHLFEFGIMGSIYVQCILGIERPRVGLLNVGEEDSKGNDIALEAYALFRQSTLNFVGNIEGRDILTGTVDVVVCDGFVGNIVLKFAESMLTFLKAKFSAFASTGIIQKLLMAAAKPALKGALTGMNYEDYGGVPLLGVNGVSIIGHGKSTPLAVKNMILRAEEVVRKEVNQRIEAALTS